MIPMAPGFFKPQAGGSDPCFDEVILLLHGEGTDGSTTITDSSSIGRTATVNGNARIRTANFKYGSSALYFDGTGDYIQYADSADWDYDGFDYTWELWVCPDSSTPAVVGRVFGQANSLGGDSPISLSQQTNGVWRVSVWNGTVNSPNYYNLDSTASATGRWDHIAIVCKQDIGFANFKFFLNGTLVDQANLGNPQTVSTPMCIGRFGDYNDQYFAGYIDEVRFTKGCARYTADFTPPSAQFPDQ